MYSEVKTIGKGTSGSAKLIKSLKENKYYISKKILLENLSEKEQAAALLEVFFLSIIIKSNQNLYINIVFC